MGRETQIDRLAPLIDDLVLEGDAARRERHLLRSLVELGLARAVALWREHAGSWSRVASYGNDPDLPGPSQVEGIARGALAPELPPDRYVLVTGEPGLRCALALAGTRADEELIDMLEALCVLHLSLAGQNVPEQAGELADSLLAPFQLVEDREPLMPPSPENASLFALLEEAREEDDDDPEAA